MPDSQVSIPDHKEFREHHNRKASIGYAGWISPKGEFYEGRGHASILADIYDVDEYNADYSKAFDDGYFRCIGSHGHADDFRSAVWFYIETTYAVDHFDHFARLITHSQQAAIRAIFNHYKFITEEAGSTFILELAADGRDDKAREYREEHELDALFAEIDDYRTLYPI